MGFVDKLKDWFSDEEEVPIKTEKTQVEISAPKEEKVDQGMVKPVETANPVFFSDDDFKEIPEKDIAKKKYVSKNKKDEVLKFKPSPIISPVYGILDKNYNKEDIANKKKPIGLGRYDYENTREHDIDRIRKKAYGTLDDDLEQELSSQKHVLVDEEFVEEKDLFEELEENSMQVVEEKRIEVPIKVSKVETSLEEELFPETNEEPIINDQPFEEDNQLAGEFNEDESFLDKEEYKEEESENDNLFNLIDTMYEKGE